MTYTPTLERWNGDSMWNYLQLARDEEWMCTVDTLVCKAISMGSWFLYV